MIYKFTMLGRGQKWVPNHPNAGHVVTIVGFENNHVIYTVTGFEVKDSMELHKNKLPVKNARSSLKKYKRIL